MNQVYRTIYNASKGIYVAVSEISRSFSHTHTVSARTLYKEPLGNSKQIALSTVTAVALLGSPITAWSACALSGGSGPVLVLQQALKRLLLQILFSTLILHLMQV